MKSSMLVVVWVPLILAVITAPLCRAKTPLAKRKPKVTALTFIYFGDWGHNVPANTSMANGNSGENFEEQTVANQITNYSKIFSPKFYIAGGDNFYQNGVVSTTDVLWDSYYRRVFTDPVTFVPWYPIFGNHDYYLTGQPQAQIDYYKQQIDSRWTFPDYQYTKTWNVPLSSKTFQVVFINTVTICPESRASTIGFPPNPNNTYPNPTNPRGDYLIRQPTLQWVENTLKSSTADYLFVAGHYHIYSVGVGALLSPENACLQDTLVPLLNQYGVDIYVNGHVHDLEHWVVNGTSYVTSGHGSDLNSPPDPAYPNGPFPPTVPDLSDLKFQRTVGGFALFQVNDQAINFEFVDETGAAIYESSIAYSPERKALRGQAIVY
jgi:hypothetical protein